MELIMGCLLLLCFYCLSREAAAVSARMSQKKVIVVDCGHGGIDPGMIGIDGLKEKEFNLAIGMKLKKALEDYGYQVVMTREKQIPDFTMRIPRTRKPRTCKSEFSSYKRWIRY